VRRDWLEAYSPAVTERALESLAAEPAPYKISHFVARLFFRGIYFPQKETWRWLLLIARNSRAVYRLAKDASTRWHDERDPMLCGDFNGRLPASSGD
jgi:hypothetical protein